MKNILSLAVGIAAIAQLAVSDEKKTADGIYQEAVALKYRDEIKSIHLFVEAAKLKHPASSAVVAELVENEGFEYKEFGATRGEAKIRLLRTANTPKTAKTTLRLGNGLIEFGERDEGLDLLRELAESGLRDVWRDYYESVFAKPTEQHKVESGYFFVVAYLQFVHPESLAAKNAWETRQRIAEKLSRKTLDEIHKEVDEWLLETEVKKLMPFNLRGLSRATREKVAAVEAAFRETVE